MGTKFRVTLIGTYVGQTFNNVLNFDNTGAVMTAAQVADELIAFWVAQVRAQQTNNTIYTGVRVQPMEAGNPASVFKPVVLAGLKTTFSGNMPFICGVLKIGTAFGGKQGRGRIYVPGLMGLGVTDGLFTLAALTTINDQIVLPLNAQFNGLTGTSALRLGVMGKAVSSPFHVMTNLSIRSVLGIQRRRQIGVGI